MVSSVPSELLFSEAGDQVTEKRNRLDPDKVNKMMFVEDYYKFDNNILKKALKLNNKFAKLRLTI